MMKFAWSGVGRSVTPDAKQALLKEVCALVAKATGVAWTVTSYLRKSPGHQDGDAIDIAPAMLAQRASGDYATSRRSDPVLHFRPLILQTIMGLSVVRLPALRSLAVVVGIENDHLHIQLVKPKDPRDEGRVVAFPFGKDMTSRYPDSLARQRKAAMAVTKIGQL